MGASISGLAGSVDVVLARDVAFVDPPAALAAAMLEGWTRQQQSRFLRPKTIVDRVHLIERFTGFTGLYPWQWSASELEAFISSLVSRQPPLAHSTVRNYQLTIALFCAFAADSRYGWSAECARRFGQIPQQICHDWNTVVHTQDYEGRPGRRALTYDEVQALFDAADERAEHIRRRGRKGALAAMRDAALLKTVYAFGLRRREAVMLDLADFGRNPRAAEFGSFGAVYVRHGKASRGGPPKRRTVLTVPEMDWIVGVLDHWRDELRPLFNPGGHPAMWVTERRGRISTRHLNEAFVSVRDEAGLPGELDLHCLRHSYVTHLVEFGYPALMVQQQVGHSHQATTAVYTWVTDEFRNRLIEQSLRRTSPQLWQAAP